MPPIGSNEESRTQKMMDSNGGSVKDPDERRVRVLTGSFNQWTFGDLTEDSNAGEKKANQLNDSLKVKQIKPSFYRPQNIDLNNDFRPIRAVTIDSTSGKGERQQVWK